MTKLYMIDVSDRIDARGVGTWQMTGELVVIDGVEHVRFGAGVILPRGTRWCETLAEAKTLAVEEIQQIAERLLRQAKAMREEVANAHG